MEARLWSAAIAAAALLACGAGARSQNFIVQAPTQQLAQEICTAAETFRRDLAIEWIGARECGTRARRGPLAADHHRDRRSHPSSFQKPCTWQNTLERMPPSVGVLVPRIQSRSIGRRARYHAARGWSIGPRSDADRAAEQCIAIECDGVHIRAEKQPGLAFARAAPHG